MDNRTDNRTDFVSLEEAVRTFGITRAALEHRVATGELIVYTSGMDRRKKLLAKEDLAELLRIKPTTELVRLAVS